MLAFSNQQLSMPTHTSNPGAPLIAREAGWLAESWRFIYWPSVRFDLNGAQKIGSEVELTTEGGRINETFPLCSSISSSEPERGGIVVQQKPGYLRTSHLELRVFHHEDLVSLSVRARTEHARSVLCWLKHSSEVVTASTQDGKSCYFVFYYATYVLCYSPPRNIANTASIMKPLFLSFFFLSPNCDW